jgi:hypothetical protein
VPHSVLERSHDSAGPLNIVHMLMVAADGMMLQHCTESMMNDPRFVLASVKSAPRAIQFASAALQSNAEFCARAVEVNGLVLQFLSDAMHGDKNVVRACLQQNKGFHRHLRRLVRRS